MGPNSEHPPMTSAADVTDRPQSAAAPSPFPPIEQFAFLSNCHTGALVAPDGAIGWLCVPRFDSPSVFGTLLDRQAGYFRLAPFGMGNPGVRLLVPGARVRDVRPMGQEGKHARFNLHSGAHRALGVAFGRSQLGVGADRVEVAQHQRPQVGAGGEILQHQLHHQLGACVRGDRQGGGVLEHLEALDGGVHRRGGGEHHPRLAEVVNFR